MAKYKDKSKKKNKFGEKKQTDSNYSSDMYVKHNATNKSVRNKKTMKEKKIKSSSPKKIDKDYPSDTSVINYATNKSVKNGKASKNKKTKNKSLKKVGDRSEVQKTEKSTKRSTCFEPKQEMNSKKTKYSCFPDYYSYLTCETRNPGCPYRELCCCPCQPCCPPRENPCLNKAKDRCSKDEGVKSKTGYKAQTDKVKNKCITESTSSESETKVLNKNIQTKGRVNKISYDTSKKKENVYKNKTNKLENNKKENNKNKSKQKDADKLNEMEIKAKGRKKNLKKHNGKIKDADTNSHDSASGHGNKPAKKDKKNKMKRLRMHKL